MHPLRIIIISAIILLSAPYSFTADVPDHLYVVGTVFSDTHTDTSSYNFDGVELIKGESIFSGEVELYKCGNMVQFAIVQQNGEQNWKELNYTASPNFSQSILNNAYSLTVNLELKRNTTTTSSLPAGKYRFLIDFSDNPRLKISKAEYELNLYLVGTLNKEETNPYDFNGILFEQTGDNFKISGATLYPSTDQNAEFAVTPNWESNEVYTALAPWNFEISDSQKQNLSLKKVISTNDKESSLMQITPGDYDFEFDNSGFEPVMTIKKHSISTALPSLTVDDYEPEYYTLTGIRIKAPDHGIYIVRRGATVAK